MIPVHTAIRVAKLGFFFFLERHLWTLQSFLSSTKPDIPTYKASLNGCVLTAAPHAKELRINEDFLLETTEQGSAIGNKFWWFVICGLGICAICNCKLLVVCGLHSSAICSCKQMLVVCYLLSKVSRKKHCCQCHSF